MPTPLDPAAALLLRQVTFNAPQGQVQAQFTASITGTVLNVTAVAQGVVAAGLQISGAGIPPGVYIVEAGLGPQVPGTISVVGGGTPTGSGLPANAPSAPAQAGVVTGQAGAINTGNSGSTGNQTLTGTGGIGTYQINIPLTIGSESMTAATAQLSTGPAVITNSNPIDGGLTTQAINPGAVGYGARAQPYSPAPQTQINSAAVSNPAVLRPANDVAQIDLGNSVITRAMPQWAPASEAGDG